MIEMNTDGIKTLTFDIFGTVLDLAGSLVPPIQEFLSSRETSITAQMFWQDWRSRQRIEQYQDNLLMVGHSGYQSTCRRAFIYCLNLHKIPFNESEVDQFMSIYQDLKPYPDAIKGLRALSEKYELVALSNGELIFLEHLVKNNIKIPFDAIFSVESVGKFKPHPSIYRYTAQSLNRSPSEIMMVAAHAFDILGAQTCGYKGAYVNRYDLPTEYSTYQPDIITEDFLTLSKTLLY
tara:strand:- start:2730 stop:3434 length:705 start_codon:yes stop_codon:yes gene_type:complete